MATDIDGRLEVQDYESWYVVFLLTFLHAAPALLGDLFGVGDAGHFAAIAPERGMPLRSGFYDIPAPKGSFGHTWITASEIAAIDWNEARQLPDGATVTRGDSLDQRWRTAFNMMSDLVDRYDPDHVRMVIWFHEVKDDGR